MQGKGCSLLKWVLTMLAQGVQRIKHMGCFLGKTVLNMYPFNLFPFNLFPVLGFHRTYPQRYLSSYSLCCQQAVQSVFLYFCPISDSHFPGGNNVGVLLSPSPQIPVPPPTLQCPLPNRGTFTQTLHPKRLPWALLPASEPWVDASGQTLPFGEMWGWMFWREKCWVALVNPTSLSYSQ